MARRKQKDIDRLRADLRALQADASALTRDARKVLGSSVTGGVDAVADGLAHLREQLDSGIGQITDYADDTARATNGWLQSRPLANLVGAFALGIALGSLALRRGAH